MQFHEGLEHLDIEVVPGEGVCVWLRHRHMMGALMSTHTQGHSLLYRQTQRYPHTVHPYKCTPGTPHRHPTSHTGLDIQKSSTVGAQDVHRALPSTIWVGKDPVPQHRIGAISRPRLRLPNTFIGQVLAHSKDSHLYPTPSPANPEEMCQLPSRKVQGAQGLSVSEQASVGPCLPLPQVVPDDRLVEAFALV